jgi:phage/plasmid-associated DNA primase
MDIVVKIPDKHAPGFIRRQITTLEYALAWRQATASNDDSPETLRAMLDAWQKTVDHLLQFVVEPADRNAAREALLQASEEEINKILEALRGKEAKPPLPS